MKNLQCKLRIRRKESSEGATAKKGDEETPTLRAQITRMPLLERSKWKFMFAPAQVDFHLQLINYFSSFSYAVYVCFFPLHSTLLARDKSEFQMCSFFHHQFIRFDFFSHSISLSLDECASQFHFQIFSAPSSPNVFPYQGFPHIFTGLFFFHPLLINEDFFSCNRSKIHQLKITRETSGNSSLDTHCFCCSSSAIVNRRGWANLNNCTTVKNRCWKSLNFHYKFRYHSQFKWKSFLSHVFFMFTEFFFTLLRCPQSNTALPESRGPFSQDNQQVFFVSQR